MNIPMKEKWKWLSSSITGFSALSLPNSNTIINYFYFQEHKNELLSGFSLLFSSLSLLVYLFAAFFFSVRMNMNYSFICQPDKKRWHSTSMYNSNGVLSALFSFLIGLNSVALLDKHSNECAQWLQWHQMKKRKKIDRYGI